MTEGMKARLIQFRRENGLRVSGGESRIWLATLGSLIIPLPNFKWRREAIDQHDIHHMMTGYPVTASGELCLAAWEVGVRCYANFWARGLCHFLMGLGLVSQPRKTLNAFRAGRNLLPIYAKMNTEIEKRMCE